jgi:GAF domain-containing protein
MKREITMVPKQHVLSSYLGISPRTPEGTVLRLLVELGIESVAADEGSLLVLDRRANELVFAMTAGASQSEKTLQGQRVPVGKGLVGLAAATGDVQIGAPKFKDVRQRKRAGKTDGHPSAVLAAPMLVQDQVVGVITAAGFDPHKRFTQRDASVYAKIAAVAGVVVEQHRQLRAVERIQRRRPPGKALSPHERQRIRIVDYVSRLARRHSDRLADIAAMLKAIDAVCSGPTQ